MTFVKSNTLQLYQKGGGAIIRGGAYLRKYGIHFHKLYYYHFCNEK